jgi:lambda family phage portal protein
MHRPLAESASPRIYAGLGGKVARVVDAVLSPIAPRLVVARQRARAESSALLAYDMAARKRTRRVQRASSADQDLLQDLPEMRRNSRAMVRDDSSAAAMVRVLQDNVIGTGLVPQMMVDRQTLKLSDAEADRWNDDVEAFWSQVSGQIDAGEKCKFAAMQALVLRSLVVDGEFLAHRVYVEDSAVARVVNTAWELVDVDRLQDPNEGVLDIRAGVELGPRQNAVAYWITPRHPDEQVGRWRTPELAVNLPKRWARYAGGQPSVLHGFRCDRVGQSRGVPFFAPAFALVEAMNDMLETELQAARAAAKFCAFIKQSVDASGFGGVEQGSDGQWYEKLESAAIRYLNPGEELVPYTPNRPGNNFEPFVVRVLRSICAALGLPYELVAKDFGGMNYSSARVALLEARRGFETLQQLIVDEFCQPVFASQIIDGVISGKLRMPRGFLQNPAPFLQAYWQPPAWGWVDPVKEIEASALAIENSLSTPQAEAARQGGDAEANLEQRARFLRKAKQTEEAYDLDPGSLTQKQNQQQQQQQQAADPAANQGANP